MRKYRVTDIGATRMKSKCKDEVKIFLENNRNDALMKEVTATTIMVGDMSGDDRSKVVILSRRIALPPCLFYVMLLSLFALMVRKTKGLWKCAQKHLKTCLLRSLRHLEWKN